ncbi:MAG: hypothetical protein KJ006_06980 [Thermoleophilia bacterium]|nr:hypothetical protein [Thermoleophilia bacterium]
MKVELLYFEGCPSYERLLPRLRGLVAAADPGVGVELRRVETSAEAEGERFLGSPTVRVDGRDIDPGADRRRDFGLKCRLYEADDGLAPLPPDSLIVAALRAAGG